jgi:hypothetical protein
MASITCRCGKVKLQFPSTCPRVSTECCCNSCFARVQHLQYLGGPSVVGSKPLLNSKWDNRVKVVSGRDQLYVYKMNTETMVTNIASSCCHTFLLGRHSEYDANCVTTASDFCIFLNAENLVPSSRWFSNQWTPERLSMFDKLVGIWVQEDGSLTGEDGWEKVVQEHLESIQREIPKGVEGETFDEIVDSIGRENIIVSDRQT